MEDAAAGCVESCPKFRLFQKLSVAERKEAFEFMQPFRCKPEQRLIEQNQYAGWVYFVESGCVKVVRSSIKVISGNNHEIVYEENENAIVMAVMGYGSCMGELSAIDGIAHSYSVVALEEVEGHKLAVADFCHFMNAMPVFQTAILQHLVRLVRFQSWRQEILALHNVNGAVAAQLLLIAHQYGEVQDDNSVLLPFPLRQKLLASLTGHTRESVNKVFKQFVELGYIEKRPQFRLLITDREGLARAHAQSIPKR